MIDELWKEVEEFEDRYMVSNHGRVKSLARVVCNPLSCRTIEEVIMKVMVNNNGYLYVILKYEGKRKKFYVHRLVAGAFIQRPHPEAGQVNHKDKNRENNHYSNLEWMTNRENCAHRDRK